MGAIKVYKEYFIQKVFIYQKLTDKNIHGKISKKKNSKRNYKFSEIEITERVLRKNAHCRSLQRNKSCSRVCANKLLTNTSKKVQFQHD